MNTAATATLWNGTQVSGRLTTEHAASSYGQPVFVDDNGQAYDAWQIVKVTPHDDLQAEHDAAEDDGVPF